MFSPGRGEQHLAKCTAIPGIKPFIWSILSLFELFLFLVFWKEIVLLEVLYFSFGYKKLIIFEGSTEPLPMLENISIGLENSSFE